MCSTRRAIRSRPGLITNRDLGADDEYGTAEDVEIGGMATWAVLKAQARDILGIELTDADAADVPLLATDAYGNFIRGPNGFPQVVMKGPDGLSGTADDVLVEGSATRSRRSKTSAAAASTTRCAAITARTSSRGRPETTS